MYGIKLKLVDEFKIRVLVECVSPFDIVNFKEYTDDEISNKSLITNRLEAKAYNFYLDALDVFKDILTNKKFKVTFDQESKLYTTEIFIDDKHKDLFKPLTFNTFKKDTASYKVTDENVIKVLENYISALNDMLDILS